MKKNAIFFLLNSVGNFFLNSEQVFFLNSEQVLSKLGRFNIFLSKLSDECELEKSGIYGGSVFMFLVFVLY